MRCCAIGDAFRVPLSLAPGCRERAPGHKREIIQARRSVSDRDLLWWFSDTPRAIDVMQQRARLELEIRS